MNNWDEWIGVKYGTLEQAETYTYQEDSKFGLIEAKITIREVKR